MKKLAILSLLLSLLFGCGNNGETDSIKLSGTVETVDIILSSQVAGKVLNIELDDGATVTTGDTIMIIDPETYKIQLMQAEAQQDLAKAKYDLLKNGARVEDIRLSQEAVKQAKANYESAQKDYERFKELFYRESITRKQLQDAETRFKVAEAQYKSAKESTRKIRNLARPEELNQAQAALNAAKANVRLLQKRVNDCYILSPLNGQIIRNYAEIGENVSPQSSLVKISNLPEVEVVVYIQENDLGKVKLGQKANVYSDSYGDKAYEGSVTYISPEAEFTPKNIQTKEERTKLVFAVEITVPNPEFELKAGMPVDAEIFIK